MLKTVKESEKQLTYLTRVTLTLFSYGMPASTSKAALMGKKVKRSLDDLDCGDQMNTPE